MIKPDILEALPDSATRAALEFQGYTVEQIAALLAGVDNSNRIERLQVFQREHRKKARETAEKAARELVSTLVWAAILNMDGYAGAAIVTLGNVLASGILPESLTKGIKPELLERFDKLPLPMRLIAVRAAEDTVRACYAIFQSTGFTTVRNGARVVTGAEAFTRREVDKVLLTGKDEQARFDAIKSAIKETASSGTRTMLDPNGHADRIDVAVHTLAMVGIHRIIDEQEYIKADAMGVTTFEVSWHERHRESHGWGGRRFSTVRTEAVDPQTKRPFMTLEEMYATYGGGTLDDHNCKHSKFAIYPDDQSAYSDNLLTDLEHKEQESLTYQGREYTPYQAQQQQQALERRMRELRFLASGYKGAGLGNDYTIARARYMKLRQDYSKFCAEMGLSKKYSRVYSDTLGRVF